MVRPHPGHHRHHKPGGVHTRSTAARRWKYSDTGQDLGTNWSQPNYDDSGWASGPARLGYGDPAVVTTVSYGPDPTNRYITTYYRHSFVAPGNVVFTNLNFRLSRVDGAVVWLNGQEAFRTNMPAGPITYTNLASQPTVVLGAAYTFYPTNIAVSNLPAGMKRGGGGSSSIRGRK